MKNIIARWKDAKKIELTFFAAIALANFVIYYPSLFHIARGDQWCYLADTADYDDWFSLVTGFYSYNRVRLFNPGDVLLFRPVIFLLLGTEKWAFGHNFFYWQLTGVILHLVLIWYLLKFLLKIYPGIFAYLLAFFFSTLSAIMEMVIWHHINGYILFMIFVLGALYHAYSHVLEGQSRKWRLWVIVIYLTLACFTHELGIVVILFLALYLLIAYNPDEQPLNRKWTAVLAVPLVAYFLIDYLDGLAHPYHGAVALGGIFSNGGLWNAAYAFFCMTASWIYAGIFPLMEIIQLGSAGRLVYGMPDCRGLLGTYSYNLSNPLNYIGLIAIIMSLILISRIIFITQKKNVSYQRLVLKKKLTFLMFLISTYVAFLIIITLGRILFLYTPETNLLNFNSYYSYIFWALLIIIIYLFSEAIGFERLSEVFHGYMRHLTIVLLLALSLLNSYRVFTVNQNMRALFKPTALFIKQVDSFIYAHRDEPDFSFAFAWRSYKDVHVQFLWKTGDNPPKEYYISDILYQKYLNQKSPKYILYDSPSEKRQGGHEPAYKTNGCYNL